MIYLLSSLLLILRFTVFRSTFRLICIKISTFAPLHGKPVCGVTAYAYHATSRRVRRLSVKSSLRSSLFCCVPPHATLCVLVPSG